MEVVVHSTSPNVNVKIYYVCVGYRIIKLPVIIKLYIIIKKHKIYKLWKRKVSQILLAGEETKNSNFQYRVDIIVRMGVVRCDLARTELRNTEGRKFSPVFLH